LVFLFQPIRPEHKILELIEFHSPTFFEAPPETVTLPAAGEQLNPRSGWSN
jgi:hypothetical protein